MSHSDSEVDIDHAAMQDDDHLTALLPRIRILTIFAYWWEELEGSVYSDTARTIRCLHVISRIIEDATFASSSDINEIATALVTAENVTFDLENPLLKNLKEEFTVITDRLVKVVIEDFADVAYSVFQLSSNSSDVPFLKAVTRFLVAFKNACVKSGEDFYAIFLTMNLEGFIASFINYQDDIIAARIAYITGELIEDTNSDAPVEINSFINQSIKRYQTAFEQSALLINDIPKLIARLFHRTQYLMNSNIIVPLPQHANRSSVGGSNIANASTRAGGDNAENGATENEAGWFTDDCDDITGLEYHVSIAIGHLRLLGSVADYTETLPPVVESDFVSLCLRTLEFPLFDLQSVALSWFGSALAHKKIASEFIEKDGMRKLIAFMNPAQQEGKTRSQYYETKAQHVSFITVALAKHSQVMDTFIQDENVANELVAFGLQLLLGEQGEAKQGEGDIMVDTQLNIIEWFGDCFGHPYMLKAVNQTNLLSIIIQKIQASLLQDDDQSNKKMEKLTLLNHSLRREAVRSLLKYLVFNLYYAVQYTKKVESSQSHFVTSSNVGFSNLTRPSPGGRTRNVGGNTSEPWLYAQTNTSSSRHEFSWLNSINMMKLDEAALAQLELFVIQYIIDHGALPTGMKIDLFHAFDFNFTSNSVLLSGIAEDDAMSIASTVKKSSTEWIIAKQFLQSQVIPVMLKALLIESKDSSMFCLVLSILELLCLDYSMILEIQHCQVSSFFLPSNLSPHQAFPSTSSFGSLITNHAHISVVNQVSSANQMKKGIEILLGTISQESRKDPSIVTAALRVLAAMSTPPYFRYKGNNLNKAKSLLSEVLSHRKHLATNVGSSSNIIGTPNTSSLANPNSAFSKKSGGPLSTKKTPMGGSGMTAQILGRLEQIQKGVRTAIRSCSGITSLVQLIHYKKNQFYIISIRLETIKVLIGISHDAEIKLILSKMRIPMILEHQVKLFDGSNLGGAGHSDYYGDGHVVTPTAVVTKTIEKDLLFLYADSLIKLLTNTSSSSTGIDGVVVTDENLHASQELLDRKAIVDHSHIEFYESELMFLIKDHLLSKGMTQTVEMLEKECGEVDPSVAYSHSAGCGQFKAQSYNSIPVNNAQLESRKRQYDTILEDTIQGHLLSQSLPPTQPSQEESNLLNPTDLASSVAIDSVKRARRSSSPFMTLPFSQSQAEGIHSAQLLTIDPLLQPSQEKEQFRILPPVPRSLRRKAIKKAFQSDERNLPASLLTEPINTFEQSYPPPTASGLSPIPLARTTSGAISFTEGGSGGAKLPITSPRVKSAQTATPIASFAINVNSSHKVPASAVKEIETSSKKIYAQYPAQVQSHQKHHHQQKHHHSNSLKGNNPVPSKLSSIMHRYLKLQHQQCKHPITTLPILSLQKPHACSKPSNLFTANKPSNIYSITSRRYAFSNTAWYNCYYRKHDFQQQLQYIYSNYRTIKSFRELESPSAMTATVFSKKMNQLYIAFNDYTMEEDPGIAMVDILTGQVSVSGHNDLHGTIMKLILSPNDYLMLTAVSPEEMDVHRLETVLEHELYLWRDPNDITVFDSPYLQRFRIKSENELMALTSSMYIPTEQFDRANYFHAEAFDPFHNNRLAALKINDFFHQSTGGIAHRTGTTTTTSTAATSATGGNNDEHQSSSYIFDIETGQIMESLYNDGNNDTYSIPKIHYHPHHPSLFFMDGKLWDLRINQIIHKFDKLSNNGNIAVHPYRSEVLIDHAVWDLRNFSLIQMIPLLENCLLHFHDYDSVLYAYHSILDNEVLLEKLFQLPSYSGTAASAFNSQNREQLLGKGGTNGFHVFHSGEYTHLHTEYIEKEYFQLMSLQTDPFQNGYMSSLLLNIHDVNDSIVRIYEIGKRKRLLGGGDSDGEDDDEDESDAEDEDWRNMSDEDDDEDDEDDDEDGDDDLDMDLEEVMSDDDDGEEEEEEDGEDDSENSDSDDDESYEGEEESEEIEDENNFSLRREGSRRGGLNRSGTDENETISEESEDVRSGEVREMEQDDEEWETVSEDSDSEEDDTDNNSS